MRAKKIRYEWLNVWEKNPVTGFTAISSPKPPLLTIPVALASGNEIGLVTSANVTAVMRSLGSVTCKKSGAGKIGA